MYQYISQGRVCGALGGHFHPNFPWGCSKIKLTTKKKLCMYCVIFQIMIMSEKNVKIMHAMNNKYSFEALKDFV